jgi:MGT family glycosyltransferase
MNANEGIKPSRFLFAIFEGGGNIPPILHLASRLVKRGHSVRVISDPCNEIEVRMAGCEFIPYKRVPHRKDKSAESTLIKDYEAKDALGGLKVVLNYFCDSALACAQDILEEIAARPVDLIAVHELIYGAYFAAEKKGIPAVMLVPSCYTLPAPGMPPPGMMPLGGLPGKVLDRMTERLVGSVMNAIAPKLNSTRQALGLTAITDYAHYFDHLARILIMTSPVFDFKGQFGENVHYVGPVLDDPTWVGEWQSPWPVADPRPLVVASFGTTFQNQALLIEKTIQAMDGMPIRGLVTLGPAIHLNGISSPRNVVICSAAPHQKIFPAAAVVVTHAGHGTVIRALASGVPLICIPIGRDQPGNAARVVYHKAGLRLPIKANVADIRKAIQKVIHTPSYGENARRLGQIIQADAERNLAVLELEQAIV